MKLMIAFFSVILFTSCKSTNVKGNDHSDWARGDIHWKEESTKNTNTALPPKRASLISKKNSNVVKAKTIRKATKKGQIVIKDVTEDW